MGALTGTGALVKLALRRDRVKLSIWIVAIAALMAANIPAVMSLYGESASKQITYAASTAPSVISRVFGGPVGGPQIGEIVMNETFLFTAIAVAFMSTLAVIRHTRQNEETGREELIGSAVVGRQASLAAALLVAIGANLILGVLTALAFMASDLPQNGSIAVGAALAGVGIVFAAIGAIAAQISDSARGANGLAGMAIGIAFLLRAIGDALGQVTNNGLSVVSAWPSWLSPLGWGQQMYPFSKEQWWALALFPAAFIAFAGLAFVFNSRRDVGLGMIASRPGPAEASPRLLSPLGLAWRLQKGTLIGWTIGTAVMGVTVGMVAKEFEKLFTENESASEFLETIGGTGSFTDILFAAMFSFMAVAIAGYGIQALLRIRSEEASGRADLIIGTAISKPKWMMSHITCAFFGILVLSAVFALTAAIAYILITDGDWSTVPSLLQAAFVHVPAIAALASVAIATFGLLPRLSIAVAWSSLALCLLILQFGELLKLPAWVINISPFTHSPTLPTETLSAVPLLILSGTAITLFVIGLAAFRRRDLASS